MHRFRRAATGATAEALAEAARELGVVFPSDYVAFMRATNGGEGVIGEGYLVLWRVEELVSLNAGYGTAELFPSWAFVGSDGGGEAVALKRGSEPLMAFVPFIGREKDAVVRGSSLDELLLAVASGTALER